MRASAAQLVLIIVALAGIFASSGHAAPPITAIAFAPGGKQVVVASQTSVAIHDWPSLKMQREFSPAFSHVHDLAFSSDGKLLAIAGGEPSESGGFQIFNWPDGEPRKPQRLLPDVVYQLAWTASDQKLALAGAAGRLILANLDGNVVQRFQGHSRDVLCVAASGDGKLLFSGSGDQSVRVWNVETGELVRTLGNHTGEVRDLALRPQQQGLPMLASAGGDKTVRFWQPTIGRMVRFVRLESAPLAIDWTPDGKRLLAACEDGRLCIISFDSAQVVQTSAASDGWAYAVSASPDGQTALVAAERGQLQVIDLDRPASSN